MRRKNSGRITGQRTTAAAVNEYASGECGKRCAKWLIHNIERLAAMKWFSIIEKLPKDGAIVDVFTTCKKYKLVNGRWSDAIFKCGKWYAGELGIKLTGVTHWRNIPKPPTERYGILTTSHNTRKPTLKRSAVR